MLRIKGGKSRAEKQENLDEHGYKIYAATFHGHYLDPIRQQFILRGQSGLRRRVIVIDFDEERKKAVEEQDSLSNEKTKARKLYRTSGAGDIQDFNEDFISIEEGNQEATLAIDVIRRELQMNADVTNSLLKERQFNLVDYWFESLRHMNSGRLRNSLVARKSLDKDKKAKNRPGPIKENSNNGPNITCAKLKPQRHNKIGRSASMAKFSLQYIEDEPERSKIFVILVGTFNNKLYLDLLRRGEPLQAIFNFYPDGTAYELLVQNFERRTFVEQTLEKTEDKINNLRRDSYSKPTGIFQNFIPLISICRAEATSKAIFDQLCWAFYDVEALHKYYLNYYVVPYNEIDISLPNSVQLDETFDYVNHLYLQGNYLMSPLPGIVADDATILIYLDMLLSTVDKSADILTEWQMVLLSTPLPKRLYALYYDAVSDLAQRYADAFDSITKIKKVERLFLEANNRALTEMVQYVDQERFRHIYLTCLEFKVLRKYLNPDYHRNSYHECQIKKVPNVKVLPNIARLYTTDDGITQRILTLMDEYENLDVTPLNEEFMLYHFRRNLNEITECNRMYTLPTRLCFRDFTLYQLDQFLDNLMTPELLESTTSSNLSEIERFEKLMRRYADDYNPDIFIRPKSLKTRRIETVSTLLSLKASRRSTRKDSTREREIQMATEALMDFAASSGIGLPPNHPLLTGFNLSDNRQEMYVKTSKYFFEEGNVQLYEEKNCFTDTNKSLTFRIKDKELTLTSPSDDQLRIQEHICLNTNNDICVRLNEDSSECAKVVLNYPNGLSIFYQANDIEQLWSRPDTPLNEKCRTMTSFAAVIVEYKSEDLVVILRYNGEIYRLYQYDFVFSDDEEEEEESLELSEKSFERATFTSAQFNKFVNSLRRESHGQTYSYDRPRVPKEALLSRQVHYSRPSSPRKLNSKRMSPDDRSPTGDLLSPSLDGQSPRQDSQSITSSLSIGASDSSLENDMESISNELEFLKKLSDVYELTYKHLIVITTEGRVFNLMENGRCYETLKLNIEEWHDYFANESYAMREDGLRMIWGSDYLKCFHSDGTVITTTADDMYHQFDNAERFGSFYSQSSSHFDSEGSNGDLLGREQQQDFKLDLQEDNEANQNSQRSGQHKGYEHYLRNHGEFEEHLMEILFDTGFVMSNITSQIFEHESYATVYFLPQHIKYDFVHFLMEVKALDDISFHRSKESAFTGYAGSWRSSTYEFQSEEEENIPFTNTTGAGDGPVRIAAYNKQNSLDSFDLGRATVASFLSDKSRLHVPTPTSSQESKQTIQMPNETQRNNTPTMGESTKFEDEILQDVLKVWVGDDFFMLIAEDYFEISVLLDKYDAEHRVKRDRIAFRIMYSDNLPDVFHKIAARISAFKKYEEIKTEEVFFLEKLPKNTCKAKGLEFLTELPVLEKYHNINGNTVTELSKLKNIMEKFKNNFKWYDEEMSKFPRFRQHSRKTTPPLDNFPMVLDVTMYLKIPKKLCSVDNICKFLDPLDVVNFKKTRYQIKDTMNRFIHPHIAKEVHRLFSHNNWRRHQEAQKRQKMLETQRKGLYHAILRHKRFPDYFLFTQKYGGMAKDIDYFDFCLQQCMEKQKPQSSKRKHQNCANRPPKKPRRTPSTSVSPVTINKRSLPTELDELMRSDDNMEDSNWLSLHSI